MRDEDLREDIRRMPDDDGPRLVYADWLSAKNNPRGEFIVVQIELAKLGVETIDAFVDWEESDRTKLERAAILLRRQAQLLAEHGARWIDETLNAKGFDAENLVYRRGFLSKLVIKGDSVSLLGGFAGAPHPVLDELEIRKADSAQLEGIPRAFLRSLRSLALDDCEPRPEFLSTILQAAPERRLTSLRIERCQSKTFDISPIVEHGDGLKSLTIGRCDLFTTESFTPLTNAKCMRSLEEIALDAADHFYHPENLKPFFDQARTPRLEKLRLGLRLSPDAFDWMANDLGVRWRVTKHLSLSGFVRQVDTFLANADVRDLESLNLIGSYPNECTLEAIAESRHLPKLRGLRLGPNDGISVEGIEALSRCQSATLVDLELLLPRETLLSEAVLEALLTRHRFRNLAIETPAFSWRVPALPAAPLRPLRTNERVKDLRRLRLSGFALVGNEIDVIAKSPLNQLRSLSLNYCDIDDSGAQSLARSSAIRDVAELDLSNSAIRGVGARALVASAGSYPFLQRLSLGDRYDVATFEAIRAQLGTTFNAVKPNSMGGQSGEMILAGNVRVLETPAIVACLEAVNRSAKLDITIVLKEGQNLHLTGDRPDEIACTLQGCEPIVLRIESCYSFIAQNLWQSGRAHPVLYNAIKADVEVNPARQQRYGAKITLVYRRADKVDYARVLDVITQSLATLGDGVIFDGEKNVIVPRRVI